MLVQERLYKETITNLPAVHLLAEVEAVEAVTEAVPVIVLLLDAHTAVEVEDVNGAINAIYFRL